MIYVNENIQKVGVIKVKPNESVPREDDEVKEDKNEESKDKNLNEVEMISQIRIMSWKRLKRRLRMK